MFGSRSSWGQRVLPVVAGAVTLACIAGPPARAGDGDHADHPGHGTSSIAVIGDTPYDRIPSQVQSPIFGETIVRSINADREVRTIVHLGDLKSGGTACDNAYYRLMRGYFDDFEEPLVYTPGDNDWTDCHRTNNGAYVPTERLAKVRRTFFPRPGLTLGERRMRVLDQAGYPENVTWMESGVVLSTIHLVGSNNGKFTWWGSGDDIDPATGIDYTAVREAEVASRTTAAVRWIDRSFRLAKHEDAAGVVLMTQADFWDALSAPADLDGFVPVVEAIAEGAARFGKPVLLLEGDTHNYRVDQPFVGSPSLAEQIDGVPTQVPNLTRVVVWGDSHGVSDWLRVDIDPRDPKVFTLVQRTV